VAATAARRAAFDITLRIDRDAAFADEMLHSARVDRLEGRERAFVTELVMGSLRRRGELDHLISRRLRKPLPSLDLEVLTALRLGAYQLRHMSGVAVHAAVSQSVDLAKWARKRSAAPLVNAILRRLPPSPPPLQGARLSHPAWLVSRWEAALGRDNCNAFLKSNLHRPATYFRIPPRKAAGRALERLRQAGIGAEATDLPGAYRLTAGAARTARAAAGARLLRFQDINSQRVGSLLAASSDGPVLDVCAAPGGKSRLLAESSPVVASDRHLHRLRVMRHLGTSGICLLALDAERRLPFSSQFDRVLVDVPCSGTGTLARNPEIKWRLQPNDLEILSRRQKRILGNALDALAPGGTLVYATCSLEPEENEHVVEAAMRAKPGWPARKVLCTVPGRDPGDGFQAWRIQRPAD
jgi:16S rRNA (cytosine967-C5)-methyltransferase